METAQVSASDILGDHPSPSRPPKGMMKRIKSKFRTRSTKDNQSRGVAENEDLEENHLDTVQETNEQEDGEQNRVDSCSQDTSLDMSLSITGSSKPLLVGESSSHAGNNMEDYQEEEELIIASSEPYDDHLSPINEIKTSPMSPMKPSVDESTEVLRRPHRQRKFKENISESSNETLAKPETSERNVVQKEDNVDSDEVELQREASTFDPGSVITEAFGGNTAQKLGSDRWSDRQDGFDDITHSLTDPKRMNLKKMSPEARDRVLTAAIAAANCGMEDRVLPVLYCALTSLEKIFSSFERFQALKTEISQHAPLRLQLMVLMRNLMKKYGDKNKRTQHMAKASLISFIQFCQGNDCQSKQILSKVCKEIEKDELALPIRLEILRSIITSTKLNLGFTLDGEEVEVIGEEGKIPMKIALDIVLPALSIADDKTRNSATDILTIVHHKHPEFIAKKLIGIKPAMIKILHRKFKEYAEELEKIKNETESQENNVLDEDHDDDNNKEGVMLFTIKHLSLDNAETKTHMESSLELCESFCGPVLWQKLTDKKTWSARNEGLGEILKEFSTDKANGDTEFQFACTSTLLANREKFSTEQVIISQLYVCYMLFQDSIVPILRSSIQLFDSVLKRNKKELNYENKDFQIVLSFCIEKLFELMEKKDKIVSQEACKCLLKLTRLENKSKNGLVYVLAYLFQHDSIPLKTKLKVLRIMIPEVGFHSCGLNSKLVLNIVNDCFSTNRVVKKSSSKVDEKTKKICMEVALATQRLVGKQLVMKRVKAFQEPSNEALLSSFEKQCVENDGSFIAESVARPHTIESSTAALPPLRFDNAERRQLSSAPVGVGKLMFSDALLSSRQSELGDSIPISNFSSGSSAVLCSSNEMSLEEEALMASILDG